MEKYIKDNLPEELAEALIKFLSEMKLYNINPMPLNSKFQEILGLIGGFFPLLFIFDIEFQHIRKANPKKSKHILEFGGIMFIQKNREWSYLCSFHFNLPPITSIDKLGVIQSKYMTVTENTKEKVIELENNYLFNNVLEKYKNNPEKFKELYEEFIESKLAKRKKISYLNPIPENFNKIIRIFKDISFTLGKNDIGDENFNKLWDLYLNDKYVKERTIKVKKEWLRAFHTVLRYSIPVVKGNMDIIALDNLMDKYKIDSISDKIQIYDIALFNAAFRKFCNSAELEKSYWCLIEHSLIDPELEGSLKDIFRNLCIKDKKLSAHNPLVDSYYTLVVALSMSTRLKLN